MSESVAFAQNWGILQTRMDQMGDHVKMSFEYFQIQKWMLQTVRAENVDERNGVICLVSCFLPELWSLNCLKSAFFFAICADMSKKYVEVI